MVQVCIVSMHSILALRGKSRGAANLTGCHEMNASCCCCDGTVLSHAQPSLRGFVLLLGFGDVG